MDLKHVNAVVVGAGAGGGVVAKELSEAGLSVVLLERGGWPDEETYTNDELYSHRSPELGNAFGPDNKRYRRVVVNQDGSEEIVLPTDGRYQNIAACVGSGTVSYGALAGRFMPGDFKMRSFYGDVEGSSLEDWPITYEDLEPYYEKAEWEIGVSGDDRQNPFAPPRKKAQPMPPFALNREGKLIADTARRMGYHPYPAPMLRNSVPNRYGQVHDIDNLFIADGSLLVTGGSFNPALTIMALGYWVAAYIKKEWQGTRFKSDGAKNE
jgi:choline dehydrogenase-like flavoprotein